MALFAGTRGWCADGDALRKAVTFYASFDEALVGDFGNGGKSLGTRFDSATTKGAFEFEPGYDPRVFKVAKAKGIQGGALEATAALPRRGRIFFPAKDNISFRETGWGGAVSFWMNTDPDKSLVTPFCDPIQITEKGANDGGIWIDFPDSKPRDMRLGAFPAVPAGGKPIPESDANAPLVKMPKVGFKVGEWHHVVLSWNNFDTGTADATAVLFVDGKRIGDLHDRELAMRWNLDKAGIYIAENYIGLVDELGVFSRALTDEEVALLKSKPDLLAGLTSASASASDAAKPTLAEIAKIVVAERKGPPPDAPAFPFSAGAAREYQEAYSRWSGLPVMFRDPMNQEFMLIPPGQFLMGSPADEPGRSKEYEESQHPVRLTQPFYLARFETTVGQFRSFVERTSFITDGETNDGGNAHDEEAVWQHRAGTNWRRPGYAGPFQLRNEHPVVHVSYSDAIAYCDWLNRAGGKAARFALPTEAEWEWACRAGSASRFWWGNDVDKTGKVANVGDEQLKQVQPKWPREIMPMNDGHAFLAPVGSYGSNAFGLRDMLGNVWEFTATRYGNYPKELSVDPGDLSTDRGFVPRGGGWSNVAADVRSATRNADPPHFCHSNLGFRVGIKLELPTDKR